jgi:hypothetical protein
MRASIDGQLAFSRGAFLAGGVAGSLRALARAASRQPHLYAGLLDNRRISPRVEACKGVRMYVGVAVIGLTRDAGLIRHILHGRTATPRRRRTQTGVRTGGAHIRDRCYSGSACVNYCRGD